MITGCLEYPLPSLVPSEWASIQWFSFKINVYKQRWKYIVILYAAPVPMCNLLNNTFAYRCKKIQFNVLSLSISNFVPLRSHLSIIICLKGRENKIITSFWEHKTRRYLDNHVYDKTKRKSDLGLFMQSFVENTPWNKFYP